jgi:4-hydroxybutyrate CoA-transferase
MIPDAKNLSADDAVKMIRSGDKVLIGSGGAVPKELIHAMVRRASELRDVEIYHILTLGTTEETAPYVKPGMEQSFTHYALFTGPNVRKAQNEGRAYAIPIHLSNIPEVLSNIGIDVVMLQVAPERKGYFNMGVCLDIIASGVKLAKKVIVEVNEQMPFVYGETLLKEYQIDAFVPVDYPLANLPKSKESEISTRIAKHVADLIEDGSTLQMGIGAVPDAVLRFVKDRKHLGIHSEMMADGVMELMECGAVDNSRKHINPGRSVATFIMGSKKMYEWADQHPGIELMPCEYTNHIFNIAKNPKVVAINAALQIDLKGQVCSDSIRGGFYYSGIGGQLDFIRGAALSKGGKPVIALPSSTMLDGERVSKIVPRLPIGAGVVTGQGDVHWVVTEYGAVNLYGAPFGKRAEKLIQIAHPDFREELEKQAQADGFKLQRRYF